MAVSLKLNISQNI